MLPPGKHRVSTRRDFPLNAATGKNALCARVASAALSTLPADTARVRKQLHPGRPEMIAQQAPQLMEDLGGYRSAGMGFNRSLRAISARFAIRFLRGWATRSSGLPLTALVPSL